MTLPQDFLQKNEVTHDIVSMFQIATDNEVSLTL